ncbi:MAG TPA: succinate dehydrogenase cytochrome b subunit [Candidatus Limnocylindria bacterium]|nr:succinate dehydrogenase cytochrome b subunit [Candidatus Limnocylindria bacterium]
MSPLVRLLTSSIGRKLLMGATGLLLIGFLVVHLSGNLLLFVGPAAFNEYSHALVSNHLIYLAELALLLLFVLHFAIGIALTRANAAARPAGYATRRRAGHTSNKSLASTTMIVSGLVVLVFVPLHLWTFKFGAWYESAESPGVRDLYRLVIEVFRDPLHVAWYVVAMVVIGFHLSHGFASGLESLGVASRPPIRSFSRALAVVIAGGFALIPIVLFLGGGRS